MKYESSELKSMLGRVYRMPPEDINILNNLLDKPLNVIDLGELSSAPEMVCPICGQSNCVVWRRVMDER